MSKYIIGFNRDVYSRISRKNETEWFWENVVGLNEMSHKELYNLALNDMENTIIFEDVNDFLNYVNEGVGEMDYWFYSA